MSPNPLRKTFICGISMTSTLLAFVFLILTYAGLLLSVGFSLQIHLSEHSMRTAVRCIDTMNDTSDDARVDLNPSDASFSNSMPSVSKETSNTSSAPWWTLSMTIPQSESSSDAPKPYLNLSISHLKADLLLFQGVPVYLENGTMGFRLLAFLLDWEPLLWPPWHAHQNSENVHRLSITCSFQLPSTGSWSEQTPALITTRPKQEDWPFLIECPLPNLFSSSLTLAQQPVLHPLPLRIQVVARRKASSASQIVQHPPYEGLVHLEKDLGRLVGGAEGASIRLAASVCIIWNKLDRAEWAEFIEYHRLVVGVQHFYVYATDATTRIFFKQWIDGGVVSFIHWTQPPSSEWSEVPVFFLQRTMITDCVMRARHAVEWLLVLDWDELLVIRDQKYNFTADAWLDSFAPNVGSVHLERWEMRLPRVHGLSKFRSLRHGNIITAGKEMVRPDGVRVMGVHDFYLLEKGMKSVRCNDSIVYHFNQHRRARVHENDSFETEERSIFRFAPLLENAVAESLHYMESLTISV